MHIVRRPAPCRRAGLLPLLSLLTAVAGCAPDSIDLSLRADVERPDKSVVIFFVDGLDLTRLEAMVEAGELPAIRRRFVEGGTQVLNAVTSLPSVTYPNCTSVITGLYPGHHGIMGNFWMDRRTLSTYYYMTFGTYRTVNEHFCHPTIYTLLEDDFTLNIQGHTRRGVTHTIDNSTMFGWAWLIGNYTHADYYAGMQFEKTAELANAVRRWPTVVMTYYPATDEVGHRWGSSSPQYAMSLRNIDGVVQRITDAVDAAGLGDSVYYVLSSDHAHVPIGEGRRFDLATWLKDARKLRVRSEPLRQDSYSARLRTLSRYDAVAGLDQDRSAIVHLRGQRGWAYRPEPAEVEAWVLACPSLIEVPAVQFALLRAGRDRVRVLSRDGAGWVERRHDPTGPQYRTQIESGDPLRFGESPELATLHASGWHDSRTWLNAGVNATYPDFVAQVVEMFDSPHTGDVVVFAADDWSLHGEQFGGHGSCFARDMRIPLYFAGPDVPRGAVTGPARLVDIMPTILGLIDQQHHLERVRIDGINLAGQVRTASPRAEGATRMARLTRETR